MRNITPVDTFTAPVQVLEDGDAGDASHSQPTAQALTNRTENLNTRLTPLTNAIDADSHKTIVVTADASTSRPAVSGFSSLLSGGVGLYGEANLGATAKGVYGRSTSGYGVVGYNQATNVGAGVLGTADNGVGVIGQGGGAHPGVKALKGSATDALLADGNIDLSTAANPLAATGFANRLTPLNLPKAWGYARLDGAGGFSASDAFNGAWSYVTISGVSCLKFTFATAMADTNYAVILYGPIISGAFTFVADAVPRNTTDFSIQVKQNDATDVQCNAAGVTGARFQFVVFGRQ